MILHDFHMHPQIMQNPDGFDTFVQAALAKGLTDICITDHMPLLCSSASDRIPKGRVAEYCEKAYELKAKYKGIINIFVGIEADWHPSIENEVRAVLGAGEFDWVIGSSHLHAIKNVDIFSKVKTRTDYAREMFKNTVSAAQSGYFNAIAHIDMYKWVFTRPDRFPLIDDGFCEKEIAPEIDAALCAIKERELYLEINPHFEKELYPSPYITERAIDMGIKFYYGSDAHRADCVGDKLSTILCDDVYGRALK